MKGFFQYISQNREKILIITGHVVIIALFVFGFAWLHHESYSLLRSDTNFTVNGRFILEDGITKFFYDEAKRGINVKKVEKVKRLFPNKLEVIYQKRNPCVAVKKGKNFIAVDDEGAVIEILRDPKNLITVAGVAGDPPEIGKAWGIYDVEAAIKMIKIINSSDLLKSLVNEIDVSNIKARVDRSSSEVELVTRAGCRLLWGRVEGAAELSSDEKIANLKMVLREYKSLDNIRYVKLFAKDAPVVAERTAGAKTN